MTNTLGNRDALATAIADARRNTAIKSSKNVYADMADELIQAGYRQTRVINTVEEMDALPSGTIILDADGDMARSVAGTWSITVVESYGEGWVEHFMEAAELPATVLWEPEA